MRIINCGIIEFIKKSNILFPKFFWNKEFISLISRKIYYFLPLKPKTLESPSYLNLTTKSFESIDE